MNNTYLPYDDINKITREKSIWESGDETQKRNAEASAQRYYNNLISKGYGGYADKLKGMNAAGASSFAEQFKPVTGTKAVPVSYSPVTSNYSGNDAKGDVNEIAWLKQVYTNGSESDKAWAGREAQKYYARLRANGFSNLADSLEGLNAGDAYSFSKSYVPDYNGQEFTDSYRVNARNAIDKQLSATKAAYGAQKTGINQQYDDSAKKLYAGYLNSSKKLPQQLAAQGITGGASESANLKLSNNYMQNLYSQEMTRNQALGQIDAAIAAAVSNSEAQKYNLENQLATMAYDISRDTRDYYANERYKNASINQNQQQIDNNLYSLERGYDFNERQLEYSKAQDAVQNAYNAASMGYFAPLAGLYGVSPQDLENKNRAWTQFLNDPNGLNTMQTLYNVGKPYYKSSGNYKVNDGGNPQLGL